MTIKIEIHTSNLNAAEITFIDIGGEEAKVTHKETVPPETVRTVYVHRTQDIHIHEMEAATQVGNTIHPKDVKKIGLE